MGYYERILDLKVEIEKKSIFLFGPRQTGKTFLLKKTFPDAVFYDLLKADVFLRVSQKPEIIREELASTSLDCSKPVIIDEIQKFPALLDEVQYLIEEKGLYFILTGSSARKLKRGGANLLGGRAWTKYLLPLVTREIPDYDFLRMLNYGSLPFIYDSEYPEQELAAYIGNYLQEEIQAEGLVRKIGNFSRFLQTASLYNSELINFANIASDAGVPARTVAEYFSILEDTLVGHILEPYTRTAKRKAITTAKFYFFDVGVCNYLAGRKNVRPKTDLFGKVLEHFVFLELKAYSAYCKNEHPLYYWRSKSGYEVDFMIGDEIAIEVKASSMVAKKHTSGIKALSEDLKLRKKIIVSMDDLPRKYGDIDVLPVKVFLKRLWSGEIF